MMTYILIAGVLFVGTMAAAVLPVNLIGAVVLPVPIAVYTVLRGLNWGVGLVVCVALGALTANGAAVDCIHYAALAGAGLVLGLGISRKWTYGWTLTAIVSIAYAAIAVNVLLLWQEWQALLYTLWDAMLVHQEELRESGQAVNEAVIERLSWMREHSVDLALGSVLWPLMAGMCIAMSLTATWLRKKHGQEGLRDSFRDMRVTEWLVWAVILVAVLWLIGSRWPEAVPTVVTWNAAAALASIYCFNGLSILVYMFQVLRPGLIVYIAIVLMVLSLGVYPLVCLIGLFDTWGNFRAIMDKAVDARNALMNRPDDE